MIQSILLVSLTALLWSTPALAFHNDAVYTSHEAICERPEVIMCDNFEDRALGGAAWSVHTYKNNGWGNPSDSICQTVSNTTAFSGTKAMRADYLAVVALQPSGNACHADDSGAPESTVAVSNSLQPPTARVLQLGDSAITVTWGVRGSPVGFRIWRTHNAAPEVQVAAPLAGVTSYTDTTVVPGHVYCYEVGAYNSSGDSVERSARSCGQARSAPTAPSGAEVTAPESSAPSTSSFVISQISVTGTPVKVYDDAISPETKWKTTDGSVSAWHEADGTTNLMLHNVVGYRLRGPDLEHLTFVPNRIHNSLDGTHMKLPEASHDFWHLLTGAYTVDGVNIYASGHSEWYPPMLNGDLVINPTTGETTHIAPADNPNSRGVLFNGFTTTVTSFVSHNGGASFLLNTVNGNHVIADTSYVWTGSVALSSRAYLHAVLFTGLQQISRIVKEGSYYYAIGNYYQRDFSQINPATGQWNAPLVKNGIVILRTRDFTNPNGWEAWVSGSTYEPIANKTFNTFLPMLNGAPVNDGPNPVGFPGPAWNPSIIYDTQAKVFILAFVQGRGSLSNTPISYIMTKSLANPIWSDVREVMGSQTLLVNPGTGTPTLGFGGNNYITLLDTDSPGYSFEFTNGNPWVFYVSHGDIFRVQLSIGYQAAP